MLIKPLAELKTKFSITKQGNSLIEQLAYFIFNSSNTGVLRV